MVEDERIEMMNHWMFKCEEISALISRSMDEDLGWWKRFGIWFHLKMCHLCAAYKDQLQIISQAIAKVESHTTEPEGMTRLPKDAAESIKSHLKELQS